MKILDFALNFLDNHYAICLTSLIALLFKFYLAIYLAGYVNFNSKNSNGIILLNAMIWIAMIGDLFYVLKTLTQLTILDLHVFIKILRYFTNACNVILHLLISLFIEYLLQNNNSFSIYRHFRLLIGSILSLTFISLIFTNKTLLSEVDTLRFTYFYILTIGLHTFYQTYRTLRTKKLPSLLIQQIQIFVFILFIPFLIIKLLAINPFNLTPNNIIVSYPFIALSIIVLTYSIYFCAKRLIGLRFLNMKDHVETTYNVNFVNDFKKTLESLSQVSNLNELKYITLQFFTTTFSIPTNKVHLFIRGDDETPTQNDLETQKRLTVEHFFTLRNENQLPVIDFLLQTKILIKDEIEFSSFYEPKTEYTESILFLNTLNSELFLPIYDKKKLIAYIVVEYGARPKVFYNNVERDEMLVFAAYVSSIINLVRNRNFDLMLAQEKELKEELYQKHQEINQYKESIRSFFRNAQDRKIGILSYKNRRFIFGNSAAQEFIGCDPNTQRGHPATILLKRLIKEVVNYQSSRSGVLYDSDNNKIIVNAVPHAEYSDIIFLLHYPDINDTIKLQEHALNDPSKWDYLLYLETTKSGQLINQLIPGNGESLLNFKIDLLKIALSKKVVLLNVPEDDLHSTCKLIHTISLRRELHILSLQEPEKNYAQAIKLFGINPLFTGGSKTEALLEQLDGNGNLYIENIHFLSLETQNALADFIQFGAFHVFKSEQRIVSDVRIICSSTAKLAELVEKKLFSSKLLNELNKTPLNMPSLKSISGKEFDELANNVARQAFKIHKMEPLLALNEREKSKLHSQNTESLHMLRKKIYGLLLEKNNKQITSEDDLEITPADLSSDPELTSIINLGKDALKDRKKMQYLWNMYKNQQKIASLLGVNRSSVNRRCKDYHLI